MDAFGVDAVLVPWSSPPFHIIGMVYIPNPNKWIYDIEQGTLGL